MPQKARSPADIFSLKEVATLLNTFRPPQGAFDPKGAWDHAYRVCSLIGDGSVVGSLRVRRAPAAEGATLSVDYRKNVTDGCTYDVAATLRCRDDAFASAIGWEVSSQARKATGEVLESTALTQSAALKDGALVVTACRRERRTPVAAPCTTHWSLFDAVQRLPRGPGEPLKFTLLDDLDHVKPGQSLAYRGAFDVALGAAGGAMRLHAFHQLGEGSLPVLYWLDDPGRLLFVISGIRGYLWEERRAP
jgi:hypothetical protein